MTLPKPEASSPLDEMALPAVDIPESEIPNFSARVGPPFFMMFLLLRAFLFSAALPRRAQALYQKLITIHKSKMGE
jgi:hypothetical protein